MIEPQPNAYLHQFTRPNEKPLRGLSKVTHQISLERRSWEQSGAALQIAEISMRTYQRWGITNGNPRPGDLEKLTKMYTALMFGEQEIGATGNVGVDKITSKLPKKGQQDMADIGGLLQSHADAFQETIKPLADQRDELFLGLLGEWKSHISADLSHFGTFAEFLTDGAFQDPREAQRAFLVLLEKQRKIDQRKGPVDLIEATKRKAVGQFVESPDRNTLATFTSQLEARSSNSKKGGNELVSWLKFASFPEVGIDVDRIATIIASGQFPGSFRTAYVNFVDEQMTVDASKARTALLQYRPNDISKLNVSWSQPLAGKRRSQPTGLRDQTTTQIDIVESPKITYALELGGKVNPTQDELIEYVAKEAREARTNVNLKSDLVRVVEAVRQDPHTLGVRRLSRSGFLYFSAHENPAFKTTDARTDIYRTVFEVVDRKDDGPNRRRIIIQDMLPHDEFDKKY